MVTPRLERAPAALLALGAVSVSNVVTNRGLPAPAYVPWNLAFTGALAGLTRAAGVSSAELGLARSDLGRGLRWGAAAVGSTAAVSTLALTRRDTPALRDRRVTELPPSEVRFQVWVRIPIGTALTEEFAFRAVLPALLHSSRWPAWAPDTVSSVLFGLWHVLPSRDLVAANDAAARVAARFGRAGATALAVAGTAAAGGGLAALRRRSHHLVAPILLHWASNAFGLVAARRARRLG